MKFEELKRQVEAKLKTQQQGINSTDLKANVDRVILVCSGVCAGIAMQPIPFADAFVLTPVEMIMVMKIGHLYGFSISKERAASIVKELAGVVGMGWVAKNLILAGYKTFIPYAGGFFTVPLVFGACYGIGKVADLYFRCKQEGRTFDKKEAIALLKYAKDNAKLLYQRYKSGEKRAEDVKNLSVDKKRRKSIGTLDMWTVLYALETGQTDCLDTPQSQLVLDAIRRSTNELGDQATVQEIADYVQRYDDEQMPGFVNNIKGIYHELAYANAENADGDSVHAVLFEDTNHPDSDVMLINEDTGHIEYVQLKATDSMQYVTEAMAKNPDIHMVTTQEMADKLGIDSSEMSNAELKEQVENTLSHLSDDDYHQIIHSLPLVSMWLSAFAIAPVVMQYLQKKISRQDALRKMGKITGKRVAKLLLYVILLSFPLTAIPTSIYLIAKYSVYILNTFRLKGCAAK